MIARRRWVICPSPRSGLRGRLPSGAVRLGVIVLPVVSSAVVAASSIFGWEPHPVLVGIQAAPVIGIGMAAFGALAGVATQTVGVCLAGLGVAGGWVLIWMEGSRAARSATTSVAPPLRVLSANLLKWNRSHLSMAASIDAHGADVVVTVETTAGWRHQLERRWDAAPVAAALGGSDDATEVVIWSRRAPLATGVVRLGGAPFPWATFETPVGPVTVVGIHVRSPMLRRSLPHWKAQLSAITVWAGEQSAPFVLAGDFNAALTNPSLRVLATRATDAARAVGSWWASTFPATTYPAGSIPLPFRVMTLDHVFVGGRAKVTGYGSGIAPGSDHDLIWADVVVEQTNATPPPRTRETFSAGQ